MSEPIDLTPHLAHALPRITFTTPRRLPTPWLAAGLLSSMLLAACGGGGGGGEPNANTSGLAGGGTLGTGSGSSSGTGTSTGSGSNSGTGTGSDSGAGTGTGSGAGTGTGAGSGTGTSSGTTTPGSTRLYPSWNSEDPITAWDHQAIYPSRSACGASEGKVFEVGPGKAYPTLKDVPWLTLIPCDQVNIYYSSTPYNDIVYLSSRGLANKWITIRGIPGPNGELPILDGTNAVMPKNTGANIWSDSAGMIIVKRPDSPLAPISYLYKPGYLHITGLKIRNARPPQNVTNLSGNVQQWNGFSAGIYVNGADKIAITNCDLGDNGLGLFVNSTNGEQLQTRNLLVAHTYFHGNGNNYSFSEHNSYSEAIGTVYEYNYFGAPTALSYGDNIKDRSAGVIFRNNYIEGGADLIALRDPESNVDLEKTQLDAWGELLVNSAFVYSNTLVTRAYLQSVIGYGDGDMGTGIQPRGGNLYFYNNRVVSMVDNQAFWMNNNYYDTQAVAVFDLLNYKNPATVVARNNLMYATSASTGATPAPLGIFYWQGKADFQANWVNSFVQVVSPAGGTNLATGNKFDGTGLGGLANSTTNPGFVDFTGGNYLTTSSSPFASLAGTFPTGITKRSLTPVADPVTKPLQ